MGANRFAADILLSIHLTVSALTATIERLKIECFRSVTAASASCASTALRFPPALSPPTATLHDHATNMRQTCDKNNGRHVLFFMFLVSLSFVNNRTIHLKYQADNRTGDQVHGLSLPRGSLLHICVWRILCALTARCRFLVWLHPARLPPIAAHRGSRPAPPETRASAPSDSLLHDGTAQS